MIPIEIRIPKKKNIKQIELFFKKKSLEQIIEPSKTRSLGVNEMIVKAPYKPNLNDLYRLYQFIILNKRTTILEFGSGWSSLIFSASLTELKNKFIKKIAHLRRNNPFELFILENESKFLANTKKNLNLLKKKKIISNKTHLVNSDVRMTEFEGRICTAYEKLPVCNPDFIYLDGPDQFNVKSDVNGINLSHKDLMPMSCDILKIEFFLIPGTIIVVDGRGANAHFLKKKLKRKWHYQYDFNNDQHIFLLKDKSFGKLNNDLLNFYKSN